jgi:hypothetical protein
MRDLPRGTRVADHGDRFAFVYGAVTLSGRPFLTGSTNERLCNSARIRQDPDDRLPQPPLRNGCRLSRSAGLGYSRFARHYSGNALFSSSYLDVSVRWLTSTWPMCSARSDRVLPRPGFPIRTSSDHRMLASPRGLTQPATSFFGSWRQGIHFVPLVA